MNVQTSTEFSKSHKSLKHELGSIYQACAEHQYSQSSNEKQGDLSTVLRKMSLMKSVNKK